MILSYTKYISQQYSAITDSIYWTFLYSQLISYKQTIRRRDPKKVIYRLKEWTATKTGANRNPAWTKSEITLQRMYREHRRIMELMHLFTLIFLYTCLYLNLLWYSKVCKLDIRGVGLCATIIYVTRGIYVSKQMPWRIQIVCLVWN